MKHFTGAIIVVAIIVIGAYLWRSFSDLCTYAPTHLSTEFSVNSIHPNSSQSAILLGQKIDINSAAKDDLEALPGIGPSLAERIVKYRGVHGRFKTIDELDNVSGIGSKTVERLREFLK